MGARILVIEDNPINMELMSYLLGAWGHQVIAAEDGTRGIAAARAERPDMIICDVQMPGLDGYEVARIIKADPAIADVPLLAVTAYAMLGDAEKAFAAGFDGHFSKPIDPAAFMVALDRLLPGPGAPRPEPAAGALLPVLVPVPPELRAPREDITLMLVDDTPANLEFKVSVLEPAGYRVQCAHDGVEALARIRDGRIDLVISDVVMPGGSGFDLLAEIRVDPSLRDLPFVFLTSTARDARSRAQGLALGANRYLVRPIGPVELLREIRHCLAAA